VPRLLQRLVEVVEDGILILNPEQEVECANEPALLLLGAQSRADLPARWREVRAGVDAQLRENNLTLTACPSLELEFSDGASNAHRLTLELFPIDERESGGLIVLIRDNEVSEALEADLRLAARYRGLNTLYRATAHDLKAPFNAIMINLDLLRDSLREAPAEPAQQERRERYLETLHGELGRLQRGLQVLLTQSMVGAEQQETFDLRELLTGLLALITPQARQQQVLMECSLPEEPIWMLGSSDWLNQALLNIAINALEAMPRGGRFTLAVATRPGRLTLTIGDTGEGIPPHVLENIWKMHFTTKHKGTGIGLYVSRNAIESHGGQIDVQTQPGEGTQFVLSLPTLN
jgi:signal transduction histidine kinase